MAFVGSPTISFVSDRKFRITGLSLDADSSGVFGIPLVPDPVGQAPDIPEFFVEMPNWRDYGNDRDQTVRLDDSVEVRVTSTLLLEAPARFPVSAGLVPLPGGYYAIKIVNLDALLASGPLNIIVEYH